MIREAWNGFVDSIEFYIQSYKDKKYDDKLKKFYISQGYQLVRCNDCFVYLAEWYVRDNHPNNKCMCVHCAADYGNKIRLEVIWRTQKIIDEKNGDQ